MNDFMNEQYILTCQYKFLLLSQYDVLDENIIHFVAVNLIGRVVKDLFKRVYSLNSVNSNCSDVWRESPNDTIICMTRNTAEPNFNDKHRHSNRVVASQAELSVTKSVSVKSGECAFFNSISSVMR